MADGCKPVHKVELKPFQLAKYPLTQSQWVVVMDWEEKFVHPDKPVINVSWDDTQEFIDSLNRMTDNLICYRFPPRS